MEFGRDLSQEDLDSLERCFIPPELAIAAGLRRVDSAEGAQIVGRNGPGNYAGVLIPYHWPGKEGARGYRLRRDKPELERKDGATKEKAKYLSAPGARNQLYLPPGIEPAELVNRSIPVCISEGEKKVLALSRLRPHRLLLPVGLAGVWSWKGTVGKEPGPDGERESVKGVIPDFDLIGWQDRLTYLVFDTNVNTNPSVRAARRQLALELERRKALVYFVDLPQLEGVNGIDDLLAIWGAKPVLDLFEKAEKASEAFYPPEHWQKLDLADIDTWPVEEPETLIESIIVKGNFVCVAAATQTGKTLLFIYVARRLVQGGMLFDRYEVHPVRKVLYLCLEDPPWRIRKRILDTDHEFESRPDHSQVTIYAAPGLAISNDRMFTYLEQLIEEEGFEVVFLDTYQKATPGISSFEDEAQSLILHRLADLTRKHRITLIVLDHVRKVDSKNRRRSLAIDDVKGTGGKAQNADCVILLEKSEDKLKFQAFSKDFDKPVGLLLEVSPEGSTDPKYTFAGELGSNEESKFAGEMTRRKILSCLENDTWMSNKEIREKVGLSRDTVRRHLEALSDEGRIDQFGAGRNTRYCLIPEGR